MKNKISLIGFLMVLSLVFLTQTLVVNAAPVLIDGSANFPAYPYNTVPYMNAGGDYVGCGPTTGAMILAYFEHNFGATGLLTNPVAGVNEGLDTAWELNSGSYMKTHGAEDPPNNGFGYPADIKPGMEDYAEDRGYEIKVMVHYEIGKNPADVPAAYGAYGDGWTDDTDFWIDLGGDVWDIDPDKFCDFVSPKLAAGIGIWLSVDPGDSFGNPTGDASHWIPCVGVDKDADTYYYYNTYDTAMHSDDIKAVGAPGAGAWAIGFMRTVTYIGPTEDPSQDVHDVEAVSQTVTDNEVEPGDLVDIDVTVHNNGDYTETFDLTCYYDSVEIGTILVVNLASGETRVATFTWDTTGVSEDSYSITAWADSDEIITEVDEANNYCTMPLEITIAEEPIEEDVHDVEAVSQTVTDNEVDPGDLVDISVTVHNNGDFTETFDLTCYYDSVEIGKVRVIDLAPGESRVVIFTWDTAGIPVNEYDIKAWADSSDEIVEVDEDKNWCTMDLKLFVIPEVPLGTIVAALSMFVALIGYVGFKRHRTK
jgi:hypothetical protein